MAALALQGGPRNRPHRADPGPRARDRSPSDAAAARARARRPRGRTRPPPRPSRGAGIAGAAARHQRVPGVRRGGGSSTNTCAKRWSSEGAAARPAWSASTSVAAGLERCRRRSAPTACVHGPRPKRAASRSRSSSAARRDTSAQSDEQRLAGGHQVAEQRRARPRPGGRRPCASSRFAVASGAGSVPSYEAQIASHQPSSSRRHVHDEHPPPSTQSSLSASGCSERTTRRGSTAPCHSFASSRAARSWRVSPFAEQRRRRRRCRSRPRASAAPPDVTREAHVAALAHRPHVRHPRGGNQHVDRRGCPCRRDAAPAAPRRGRARARRRGRRHRRAPPCTRSSGVRHRGRARRARRGRRRRRSASTCRPAAIRWPPNPIEVRRRTRPSPACRSYGRMLRPEPRPSP